MKYIDAEKLIAEIDGILSACTKQTHTGVYNTCHRIKGIVTSLQQEQPNNMIQWTGNNLKEVIDFTGKSPKFGEWFKSWNELESYVHSHGDILKLFSDDGSHFEVPVGAWIVKTPDGYNVPSVARFIHAKQEQPQLPGIEDPGIPGKDFIPVEWVDACEMYGKWKIVKLDQPEVDIEKEITEHAINMPHCEFSHDSEDREHEEWAMKEFRHFYELGLNARKEHPEGGCPKKPNDLLSEWSEEDAHNLSQFIEKRAKAYDFNLPNRGYDIFGFAKDILKYLRINHEKVEWSEEDIDASVKSYSDSLPIGGEFKSYHDALVHAYRQGLVNALKSTRH